MGLYNFQPRFAPHIRAWDADPESPLAKAHTIRAPRKGGREDKPGDVMYLYTGLRLKGAARIIEPVMCAKRESVVILDPMHAVRLTAPDGPVQREAQIWVGPFLEDVHDDKAKQAIAIMFPQDNGLAHLNESESEALALRDGFESFAEMMSFWAPAKGKSRLPFYGHIFHWQRESTFVAACRLKAAELDAFSTAARERHGRRFKRKEARLSEYPRPKARVDAKCPGCRDVGALCGECGDPYQTCDCDNTFLVECYDFAHEAGAVQLVPLGGARS